jgi:23S rRNA (pseudouridine1915-N3)-methyltransferase
MRLTVLAVGRARNGPEQQLFADYIRRLPWPLDLREIDDRGGDDAGRGRREGARILAALPDNATLVALDPGGRQHSSEAFARHLANWRDDGVRDLAFAIGGSDGLDEAVLKRADAKLCLGAMIWPHLLARVMLAEQLFRAHSILTGHPYHRGTAG